MRIGILSRNHTLYSTRRLVQAAHNRHHRVLVIDTLQAAVQIGAAPKVEGGIPGRALPSVDGIIPRIGASVTRYGVAVVRTFEAKGVVTTASSQAIAQSRNKRESLSLMKDARLPIPKTMPVSHPDDLGSAVLKVDGPPVVIKVLRGTQGRGVILARTMQQARAIFRALARHGQSKILVQEFIPEADGHDIRIIVVGHRCVAAMQRIAQDGDFRANLHRGGRAEPFALDDEMAEMAVQAARLHHIGVAGVDIIPSERGPLLLEINSSPGLQGIERVTQKDVASEVIAYLERENRNQNGGWRKRGHR